VSEEEVKTIVRVAIPAEFRFVALCRVTAASLAAEVAFDVDEIEELRIGVNELVSMLVESSPPDSEIELSYRIESASVRIDGVNEAVAAADIAEPDPLTTQVLEAVVDAYGWHGGSFWLEKRQSAEPA
jgi:serine/threonine-protein kinase RsbW